MRRNYEKVRADFEYLETVNGGADLMEVDAEAYTLMRNPTKSQAKQMYLTAIDCWFRSIGTLEHGLPNKEELTHDRVVQIGEDYGCL